MFGFRWQEKETALQPVNTWIEYIWQPEISDWDFNSRKETTTTLFNAPRPRNARFRNWIFDDLKFLISYSWNKTPAYATSEYLPEASIIQAGQNIVNTMELSIPNSNIFSPWGLFNPGALKPSNPPTLRRRSSTFWNKNVLLGRGAALELGCLPPTLPRSVRCGVIEKRAVERGQPFQG